MRAALIESKKLSVYRVLLNLDLRFPHDLACLVETSLAQLSVLPQRADIRKVVGKLNVDYGTGMTAKIVDDFVSSKIVNEHVAV